MDYQQGLTENKHWQIKVNGNNLYVTNIFLKKQNKR